MEKATAGKEGVSPKANPNMADEVTFLSDCRHEVIREDEGASKFTAGEECYALNVENGRLEASQDGGNTNSCTATAQFEALSDSVNTMSVKVHYDLEA